MELRLGPLAASLLLGDPRPLLGLIGALRPQAGLLSMLLSRLGAALLELALLLAQPPALAHPRHHQGKRRDHQHRHDHDRDDQSG